MSYRRGADLGLVPSNVGSPYVTVAAGLPALGGRVQGDYHYDQSTGRMNIVTGLAGASGTDTFNRTAANIVGTNMESGGLAYSLMGGYNNGVPITGTLLRFDGGSPTAGPYGGFKVNTTSTAAQDISWDGTFQGSINAVQIIVRASSNAGFSAGSCYGINILNGQITITGSFGTGTNLAAVTTSTVGAHTWRVTVDASQTAPTITVYKDSFAVLSYTDNTGTPKLGTYVGIGGGGNGTVNVDYFTVDNLAIAAVGTLMWVAEDPIYLYGFVPGALSVASNVMKPGLRVPASTTLRQVVVRADTAPAGSNLVVTIERFNGGVSQGVIATVTVAAGSSNGATTGLSAGLAAGDILRTNVTAVGSTTAGSDMLVSCDCY